MDHYVEKNHPKYKIVKVQFLDVSGFLHCQNLNNHCTQKMGWILKQPQLKKNPEKFPRYNLPWHIGKTTTNFTTAAVAISVHRSRYLSHSVFWKLIAPYSLRQQHVLNEKHDSSVRWLRLCGWGNEIWALLEFSIPYTLQHVKSKTVKNLLSKW